MSPAARPIEQHRLQVDDSLGDQHRLAFIHRRTPVAGWSFRLRQCAARASRPGKLRRGVRRRVDVFVTLDERERHGNQLVGDLFEAPIIVNASASVRICEWARPRRDRDDVMATTADRTTDFREGHQLGRRPTPRSVLPNALPVGVP
jgi:hypothetical protein